MAWYNGHPDHVDHEFDLSQRRVVVVGNGNVALDVARILTIDPETLAGSDISPIALEALRRSEVREVVVLGRRGPAESAFTVPEFVGLLGADVDIAVEGDLPPLSGDLPYQVEQKLKLLHRVADRPFGQRRRIVFRYQSAPSRILGPDAVTGIEVDRTELVAGDDGRVRAVATGDTGLLETGLVLTSVGYRGVPTPGLPFDEQRGIIPNRAGRVLTGAAGEVLTGAYVTGWIKRGPTGFIGTNKSCAQETVQQLADDFNTGRLAEPAGTADGFDRLLRQRRPQVRAAGAVARTAEPVRRLFARA
ncbi:hypothetical protein [Nocardia carnea]|uniref:hypothetical protein n=1 Tax=Nocardia carnea TaxID=37328 RepID=UPI0024555FB5|nr:hypothetical protein [Nocardia carnea]